MNRKTTHVSEFLREWADKLHLAGMESVNRHDGNPFAGIEVWRAGGLLDAAELLEGLAGSDKARGQIYAQEFRRWRSSRPRGGAKG